MSLFNIESMRRNLEGRILVLVQPCGRAEDSCVMLACRQLSYLADVKDLGIEGFGKMNDFYILHEKHRKIR